MSIFREAVKRGLAKCAAADRDQPGEFVGAGALAGMGAGIGVGIRDLKRSGAWQSDALDTMIDNRKYLIRAGLYGAGLGIPPALAAWLMMRRRKREA
jgi:hypothetical protein